MQPTKPNQIVGMALPCNTTAPRRARAALSDMLDLGPLTDDAVLIASELVTNAVKFSGCDASEEITFDAMLDDGSLTISVRDPAHNQCTPQVREVDADRPGGQGLRIVERLAGRCGVDDNRSSRLVWAELLVAPYRSF